MKQAILPGTKVGILGGGQLARMLVLDGHRLGLEMHVYSENRLDPAAMVTAFHHAGRLDDRKALENFLSTVSLATFESEFINGKLLAEVSVKTKTPLKPDPLHMDQLQDRWHQKNLLEKHGIPTAPFVSVSTPEDLDVAEKIFKKDFVLKRRRFGYDGYGTFYSSPLKPLAFMKDPHGFIAEAKISFKRELATQIFRSTTGQMEVFPLVETFQEQSRCLWVKGPVKHARFAVLVKKLKRFVNNMDFVGTLAFELFDTGKDLLVNEIAPRVHNSGHYSQDALTKSQFEMHLLACLQPQLPKAELCAPGFAMWNLLGSGRSVTLQSLSTAALHWYGKIENKPGRKMGHINAVANSPQQAWKFAQRARQEIKL